MGLLSIVGMVVCFAAIILGIIVLDGDVAYFVNVPSIALTVIPTFGALLTTCPIALLAKMPAHFKVILGKGYTPGPYITQLLALSQVARTGGLLALEQEESKISDPFLLYAVRLLTVGAEESIIKNSLLGELSGVSTRHSEATSIYEKAASYAPAFGMCATVVSLVNMLLSLDFSNSDAINSLGGNMAAALITTFYGSLLANVIFIPIATRLKLLHKKEMFCKELVIDGILAINRGDNPSNIQNMFIAQLSQAERKKLGFTGG